MKIGELARMAQCSVETIRFYEKEGLLPAPARTGGNFRDYAARHVERLRFIRNCRALDMAHDEIRALLGVMSRPDGDCGAVNQLLDDHIAHVKARIAELTALKRQLIDLRERCGTARTVEDCGIVHGLAEMAPARRESRRRTHLG